MGTYKHAHNKIITHKLEYKNIRAGRLHDPLLRIPLENVIPNKLHLMLRVVIQSTLVIVLYTIIMQCYRHILAHGRISIHVDSIFKF